MRIHVDVTAEDIAEGCRHDSIGLQGGCMVHRAVVRATEGAAWVMVSYDAIELRGEGWSCKSQTSPEVWSRIMHFDAGHKVRPFAFDLELLDEMLTGASA